jgi:hypothetical protein
MNIPIPNVVDNDRGSMIMGLIISSMMLATTVVVQMQSVRDVATRTNLARSQQGALDAEVAITHAYYATKAGTLVPDGHNDRNLSFNSTAGLSSDQDGTAKAHRLSGSQLGLQVPPTDPNDSTKFLMQGHSMCGTSGSQENMKGRICLGFTGPIVPPPPNICDNPCGGAFTCNSTVAAKTPIQITNLNQLLTMQDGNRYELANDIVVGSETIGYRTLSNVIFDGKGHKISKGNWRTGGIASQGNNLFIKNVKFDQVTVGSQDNAMGVVVGDLTGQNNCIEDIEVKNSYVIGTNVGGIVGMVSGGRAIFKNVAVLDSSLQGEGGYVGGIVGSLNLTGRHVVDGCTVTNVTLAGGGHADPGRRGGIAGGISHSWGTPAAEYITLSNCSLSTIGGPTTGDAGMVTYSAYGGLVGVFEIGYQPGFTYPSPVLRFENITSVARPEVAIGSPYIDETIGIEAYGLASPPPGPQVTYTSVSATLQ